MADLKTAANGMEMDTDGKKTELYRKPQKSRKWLQHLNTKRFIESLTNTK